MNSEITEKNSGWVLYDGNCRFCRHWIARIYYPLRRRGFRFAPLQTPGIAARFHIPETDLMHEMKLILANGQTFGGADAVANLCGLFWLGWPIQLAYHLPFVRAGMRHGYRWIASHRHCRINTRPIPAPDHDITCGFYDIP